MDGQNSQDDRQSNLQLGARLLTKSCTSCLSMFIQAGPAFDLPISAHHFATRPCCQGLVGCHADVFRNEVH